MADPRLTARCRLSRVWIRVYAPDAMEPEAGDDEAIVRQTIRDLGDAGDEAGLARAWRVKAMLDSRAGKYDDVAAAAEQLIEHAHRANELRLVARGASGYANQAVWSTQPVPQLIDRIEGFLSQVEGDRKAEANISLGLAQLHAMRGDFERARELYRRGQTLLRDLGQSISSITTSIASARVEALAGALGAAEAELRRDEADLARIDERYYRSSIIAALARVVVRQERWNEADELADLAERLADPDDTDPQILWRTVRARVLAERGKREAALALMDDAVSRAAETDDVILRADTFVDQSEVLRRAGKADEAEGPLLAALELYQRKGDIVSGRAIRERIARPV